MAQTINRRALLRNLAVLPAFPALAGSASAASPPDPAFAAIDRHRAAAAEACAEVSDPHADQGDEASCAREESWRLAVLALIATPAIHSTAIWQKWRLLDHLMTDDLDCGQSAYPYAVMAAAALKSDIFALGLKPWPDE